MFLSILSWAYWPSVYLLCRNVSSKSFLIFELGCLFFLLLTCRSYSHILDINPLSDVRFTKSFSYSLGCLCTLTVSFHAQKFFVFVFNFDVVLLTQFFFCLLCFWCHIQEISLLNPMS